LPSDFPRMQATLLVFVFTTARDKTNVQLSEATEEAKHKLSPPFTPNKVP